MWREGASECLSAVVHRHSSSQTRVSVNKVMFWKCYFLLSSICCLPSMAPGPHRRPHRRWSPSWWRNTALLIAAVEQRSVTRTDLAKKIILNLRLESLYKIWSVTVCNFVAAEFPKFIDILKWYISSARQPAPVRTRHANRLNTESNRGIRNVPLTETPMKLARDIRQLLNLQTVDSVCGNSVLARSS